MTAARFCPDCGARVIYARTAKGKRQVLNWTPDPEGNVAAMCTAAGAWHARYAGPQEALAFPEKRYMPHWATAPQCKPRPDQARAAQDVRDQLADMRRRGFGHQRTAQLTLTGGTA